MIEYITSNITNFKIYLQTIIHIYVDIDIDIYYIYT